MNQRFAIASQQVITPQGVRPAAVIIADGKIERVTSRGEVAPSIELQDFGDWVVGPGLIDSHIHINEPGRTEWEGFATATQAAAAGGITTLIDMPLNSSPVTIHAKALSQKVSAAQGQCWVDVGFYGGLVPGNAAHVTELVEAGVFGVKAFLCDSGLDEFPASTHVELNAAMPILAQANVPLLVHAELTDDRVPAMKLPGSFAQFVDSRPSRWEVNAIRMMLELAQAHRCRVHIVHLATADPAILAELTAAKEHGVPISVETCPHYLFFAAEDIPDGQPIYKCAPPIRSISNRDGLRAALLSGVIDTIGSDHSPCPTDMKYLDTGNIQQAWGGIAGVQFMLPTVWQALHKLDVSYERLFQWLSTRPAHLLSLCGTKGSLQPGCDADLVVWNPNASWKVTTSDILHKNKISPYVDQTLRGQVHLTMVRGQIVYQDGVLSDLPLGRTLSR